MLKIYFSPLLLLLSLTLYSQLKPGYDKTEALELIKVNFRFVDSSFWDSMPAPERFSLKFRSKTVGFDNKWDYWADENGVGVFSLRGTTNSMKSWGANFYSGMIPAKGSIKLDSNHVFDYELAKDDKAYVHAGWTTAIGFLAPTIDSVLLSEIAKGNRQFYITGHSQGGALAYLLTARFLVMKENGNIPSDVQFKTYCSAAPKPGNLYFAYYYENMTQNGWAYNSVNATDWVPETPFSIQTVNDFHTINPFTDAKKMLNELPFIQRVALKHMYLQMDKPSRKAERRFEKYLGVKLGKILAKTTKGFEPPTLIHSMMYTRCGNYRVLYPGKEYETLFPQDENEKFTNHMLEPYIYLLERVKVE